MLDDGNVEHDTIAWCKERCAQYNDSFGVFISEVLLAFTEKELLDMYEADWWGMR